MKEQIKEKIILIVCVLVIIIGTYFITAAILPKRSNNNDLSSLNSSGLSLNYDNIIIASDTFSINKQKYMVLFFSEKDSKDYLKTTFNLYDSSDNEIKLYKVNTDESINKFVKANESNKDASSIEDLKISGDTLITIENGKIVSYIDDVDSILETLK